MHLHKCHPMHNLHAMQENLLMGNREKIGGPLPRTPTRHRKKQHRCVQTSCAPFNLPNHSHHNMTICGLSLHHGNTESHKNLEQKFNFQLDTLSPHEINERLSVITFQQATGTMILLVYVGSIVICSTYRMKKIEAEADTK